MIIRNSVACESLKLTQGSNFLAPFVGQRLCIDFYVSRANFLTTLCSHLDVTCSCYFWSSLFNVDVNYIYMYPVNYCCKMY